MSGNGAVSDFLVITIVFSGIELVSTPISAVLRDAYDRVHGSEGEPATSPVHVCFFDKLTNA